MDTIGHPTSFPCCKNLRDRPKPGADVARRANLQKNAERPDKYSKALGYNRISCPRCRYNLREANLLSNHAEVDYNDVICEHCKKKAQFSTVCAKCENAIDRIVSGKKGRDETKARLKIWLSKVQRELKEILESTRGVGGAGALKKHVFSETYRGGLYERLHSPVSPRKPRVTQLLDSGLQRRLQHSATAAGRHVPHSASQRSSSAISMPEFGECIHVPECVEKWAETIEATRGIRGGPGSDQSDLFGDMKLHENEYKRPSRRPQQSRIGEGQGEDFGNKHSAAKSHDDKDEHGAKADRRLLQKDGENIERDKDKDQDFKKTLTKRTGDLDSSMTKTRRDEHDSEKKKTGRDQYDSEKTKTGSNQNDSEKTKTGRNLNDSEKSKTGRNLNDSEKTKTVRDQNDSENTKAGKGQYDTTKSNDGKRKPKEESDTPTLKAQTKVHRSDKTKDEADDDKTKGLKSQTKQDKIYKIESKKTGTDQGPKGKSEKGHKEAGKQIAPKADEKTSSGGDKGKAKSELESKGGKATGKPSPELERSPKKGKDQPSPDEKEFLRTIQLAKEEKAKAKAAAEAEKKKKEDAKKLAEMNKQQPKLKSIKAHRQKPADIISPSDRALDALNATLKKEEVTKIIVGQKIFRIKTPRVPLEERDEEKEKEQAPVLFKTKTILTDILEGKGDAVSTSPRAGGDDGGGGADKKSDRKDAKTKKQEKQNAAVSTFPYAGSDD